MVQTESPENFVVIFEILPIDKEWKSNEIYKLRPADLGWVVALTTGMLLFKLTFFGHIDYTRTQILEQRHVSPNKILIQFLFHSHSVLDYFKNC